MSGMFGDRRSIAVAFCAIGAFLHLYAPQSVLPMMAQEFGVGAADASLIITAGTLAAREFTSIYMYMAEREPHNGMESRW